MKLNVNYLLPDKAEHTKALYEQSLQYKNELIYEEYESAYILPYKLGGFGGVLSESKEYILLSAGPLLEKKPYDIDEVKFEDCTVVYGGIYNGHFGHFLTDTNLRTWIVLEKIWESVDYIIFTRASELEKIKDNCKEFWRLLNIYDKVRILDHPTQFSHVIIPECGYWNGVYYSRQWINMFSSISNKVMQMGSKNRWKQSAKVFLSRRRFAQREFGHREIDNFWKKNGYTVIYPEHFSLTKLIWILNNAETVAGISGTLMHHLLFCNSEKKAIICERYYPINELQIDINNIKQVNVTYIDSNICIFPTYIGNTPAILCYNERLDKFATDNHLKRGKKLKHQPAKYRKYIKKYAYEWGKNGKLNVEEKFPKECEESYKYAREHYKWLDMRPGSSLYTLVKKIYIHT